MARYTPVTPRSVGYLGWFFCVLILFVIFVGVFEFKPVFAVILIPIVMVATYIGWAALQERRHPKD